MPKQYLKVAVAQSKVDWYVSHGYSYGQIVDKLKSKFSGVDADKIGDLYSYYKSSHTKAKLVMGYSDTYEIDVAKLPTKAKNPSIVRATVNYDFNNPITHKQVQRSDTFDMPSGLTVAEFLEQLKDKIVEELMTKYDFGAGGEQSAKKRVLNLTLAQLEAI